ncbi:Hydrolase [Schizosaccharomyces pombe]
MIPSKNIQKIKLVTFDAFGTILHLSKPVPIVYSEVAQKYGVHATIDEIEHNTFKDFSEKHKNHGKKSGLNPHDWWIKVIEHSFPTPVPAEMAEELWSYFSKKTGYTIHPLLIDFLKRNKEERKYIIGIISNTDERIRTVLEDYGIDHLIDIYAFSYDVGFEKPSREIFDYAMEKAVKLLGQEIQPEECMHLGDDLIKDVSAARNIQWNAEYCDIKTNFLKYFEQK